MPPVSYSGSFSLKSLELRYIKASGEQVQDRVC